MGIPHRPLMQWCLGLIGAFLLGVLPAQANEPVEASLAEVRVFNLLSQQLQPPETLLEKLAQADVVYLGETHDREADHRAQLEIIQQLLQRRQGWTIGMEMFQRPYQASLNQFLAGKLDEAELQARSQYRRRWGYPWEFYAPILRLARARGVGVIALNAPTEVTRKVARQGLHSLTLAERRFVPPPSAIVLAPDRYRQRLRQLYDEIHQGHGSSLNFDHFFQAQVLWDETMAEAIVQQLQRRPDRSMVVLVGQGHLLYGDGIPGRVQRRLSQRLGRPLRQVTVLLNPATELRSQTDVADYFWDFPSSQQN
mgnify:CR=1 FL=1